jgi:type IV secretion system protein VirB8
MAFPLLAKKAPKKGVVRGRRGNGGEGTAAESTSAVATERPSDVKVGQWYLRQAQEFERSRDESKERESKFWQIVGIGCFAFAVISNIGSVCLVVLKRPNPPPVLRVDSSTGTVTVLPTQANGHVTWDQKVDRHNLEDYVQTRESYDWETVNDMHAKVMLESDPKEQDVYDGLVRSDHGPLKVYKDVTRVIVKAGPTVFVGDTAQVFFCKRYVQLNSGATPMKPDYGVATIEYRYVNIPEKTEDQDMDPTGFRVSSYTAAKDWTRTNGESVPGAGACE